MRVVFDPNVLISARLSPLGASAQLLRIWTEEHFELIVSPALLTELAGVLARPKFRRWLTADEAEALVELLRRGATLVDDPVVRPAATPDPADDYLVAWARAAGAAYLVSGDAHLVKLVNPKPPVLTPRAFLDHMDI